MDTYNHSGYDRLENDHYKTIDPRLVDGLFETVAIGEGVTDICAPQGSGIVERARDFRKYVYSHDDAFSEDVPGNWLVFNPPYKRPLVDQIIERSIERVSRGEVEGMAVLLRANFDLARSRAWMFEECPQYKGVVRMRFRPIWFEDKRAEPQHHFVWHVWTPEERSGAPRQWYYTPESKHG